ncbi:MAG TPA: phosphotransferase, partial [Gemmatimonadaceae bacterium]|nr:phosphotransferase [Gemmatimonadaceae bacterium]
MLDTTPQIDRAGAAEICRRHFGVHGTATALASERDQNFLITTLVGDRLVLKVANGAEDRAFLEAQHAALGQLGSRIATTARPQSTLAGGMLAEVHGTEGQRHLAWLVSWLPGRPMAFGARRSSSLLEDLGRHVGALDSALADFDHPAIHRDFYWDLANSRSIIERHRPLIVDRKLGGVVDRIVSRLDRALVPCLARLPRQAIHGDLNDYNVLIDDSREDVEARGQRVTGIVDFGDMVHSYRIGDLAIAIAYAALGAPNDSVSVMASMVRGYRERLAPTDDEMSALFGLVLLRLCASVCIAADQLRRRPDNTYLGVSQSEISRALPILAELPFGLVEAAVRDAAGEDSVPASRRVAAFLQRQPVIAAVLGVDPQRAPSIVLDLGIDSSLIDGDVRRNDEPLLTGRVCDAMRNARVELSIGKYDEPRLLYVAPAFAIAAGILDEHRTIHIGLDLFAVAGTPVFAPLEGTVHAFADNDALQDYGPVIILRHETDDGTEFFTLYGHLSRESLRGLTVGAAVNAGERIAWLGDAAVNGGWTPHLHLQIVVDLLALGTDFPGVALPSQRRAWCALCPDPNVIARVPAERFPSLAPTKQGTLSARRARIGDNLSIAYRDPVKIVRGWMQYLYDD